MRSRISSGCDEVPAEAVRTLLQSVERCGYEAGSLLKGLRDPKSLVLGGDVAWKDALAVVHRFVAVGGQAELFRVARDLAVSLPVMRRLGALLLPPRLFYRLLCEGWSRPCSWVVRHEDVASGVVIHLDLKRTLEGSQLVLGAIGHFLAATPRLLNLRDVEVEARIASPHSARYAFELPRGRALAVRPTEGQLASLAQQLAPSHVHDGHHDGQADGVPTVAALEARFGLTPAEGRVVRRLGAGRSLSEIARELSVGTETVRTHAKRAMQKTDTHRQAELVALVLRLDAAPRPVNRPVKP